MLDKHLTFGGAKLDTLKLSGCEGLLRMGRKKTAIVVGKECRDAVNLRCDDSFVPMLVPWAAPKVQLAALKC